MAVNLYQTSYAAGLVQLVGMPDERVALFTVPTVLLQLPFTGKLIAPLQSSFGGADGAV